MSASSQNKSVFLLMAVILLFGGLSAFFTLRQNSETETSPVSIASEEVAIKEKLDAIAVDFTQVTSTVPAPAPEKSLPVSKNLSVEKSVPVQKTVDKQPSAKVVDKKQEAKNLDKSAVVPKESVPEKSLKDTTTKVSKETVPEKSIAAAAPATKAVSAQPLVAPKPRVLMATKEKAWVRLDDHQTIIVRKGDSVGDMGKVLELDAKTVKFEKGAIPVSAE